MKKETYVADNYSSIYRKLEKATTMFLANSDVNELKSLILEERKAFKNRPKNFLIEIPDTDIRLKIKKDYTKVDYLEGNLGTIDTTDQFDRNY